MNTLQMVLIITAFLSIFLIVYIIIRLIRRAYMIVFNKKTRITHKTRHYKKLAKANYKTSNSNTSSLIRPNRSLYERPRIPIKTIETDSYKKRERRREIRSMRFERHNCRWDIIHSFVIYDSLINWESIYQIKKTLEDRERINSYLSKHNISKEDIETSIRFIRFKAACHECVADLSRLSVEEFYRINNLDLTPILIDAYDLLEEEWDKYLVRIKKYESRTIERLKYYQETIEKDLSNRLLSNDFNIKQLLNNLKQKYEDQLNRIIVNQPPTPDQ